MYRLRLLPATLCVLLSGVDAVLEQLQYVVPVGGNDGNCPGMAFGCAIPEVCAKDPVLDKFYCCIPGPGGVCWTGATDCSGEGANEPATGQIGCSSGESAFCCLDKREECTQTTGQVNICWSTQPNPMFGLSADESEQLYSSLLEANPEATALPVDDLGEESPSSAPTSRPTKTPPTEDAENDTTDSTDSGPSKTDAPNSVDSLVKPTSTNPTDASSDFPNLGHDPQSSGGGLSSGAIAGIVVGAVVGLALIGVGAFFLVRRNKKRRDTIPEMAANPYTDNTTYNGQVYSENTGESYYAGSGKWAHTGTHEVESPLEPVELDAAGEPAELAHRTPK